MINIPQTFHRTLSLACNDSINLPMIGQDNLLWAKKTLSPLICITDGLVAIPRFSPQPVSDFSLSFCKHSGTAVTGPIQVKKGFPRMKNNERYFRFNGLESGLKRMGIF